MKKIILASASPRRKSLLEQAGIEFEVVPSRFEEEIQGESPEDTVLQLSYGKAREVIERLQRDVIVLGADTIVACDDLILGKPADEADARRMLSMLQGRSHYVYTGVTLLSKKEAVYRQNTFYVATRVDFAVMTEEEIAEYVASGECMDKAGAYAIQGRGAVFISGICGDYNNVVGLPVQRVYHELRYF